MFKFLKAVFFLLIVFTASPKLIASQADSADVELVVRDIMVFGNNITRKYIVLRELPFQSGDTVSQQEIAELLKQAKINLDNLQLFKEVEVKVLNNPDSTFDVMVDLQERWYIMPIPILFMADRNFNVWLNEHNADLGRLSYGLFYYQKNFTGNNDRFKISGIFGYYNQYSFAYMLPYLDSKQKWRAEISAIFYQTKELPVATYANELIFHDEKRYINRNITGTIDLIHRRKIHTRQIFGVDFNYSMIRDTVSDLNPDYLLKGKNEVQYPTFRYWLIHDKRDKKIYPLEGFYADLEIEKDGLPIKNSLNLLTIGTHIGNYFHLGRNFYLSNDLAFRTLLLDNRVYFKQVSLGYDNYFVRGYEYYVIDGQFVFLDKLELKKKLFSLEINTEKWLNNKKFSNPPFTVFLKTYVDIGYVKDEYFAEHNPLTNQLLTGGGIGLDLLTYYDISLKFEYSINKMREKGFYFHIFRYF